MLASDNLCNHSKEKGTFLSSLLKWMLDIPSEHIKPTHFTNKEVLFDWGNYWLSNKERNDILMGKWSLINGYLSFTLLHNNYLRKSILSTTKDLKNKVFVIAIVTNYSAYTLIVILPLSLWILMSILFFFLLNHIYNQTNQNTL